jgi:hypothetical protein
MARGPVWKARMSPWLGSLSLLALSSGCFDTSAGPGTASSVPRPPGIFESGPARQLPAGTYIDVTILQTMSSMSVQAGDTWQGVVARPVIAFGRETLPRGCRVVGRVTLAQPAVDGRSARIQLTMDSICSDAGNLALTAVARPVVAGSTRARDIGAITGGAAEASTNRGDVGGDSKEAVAVGTTADRASGSGGRRVREAVLKQGTVMTFVASRTVAMK